MLHTAVVVIHRHPVIDLLPVRERLVVVRVDETQEVPRRPCPLRHRIRLALCGAAAFRAGAVHERRHLRERRLAVRTGFEVFHFRQLQRQLLIRYRYRTADRAVNERDRLAPVTLAVEGPVLHLILHALVADALFTEEGQHPRNGILLVGQAVEDAGIDHLPVARIGFFGNVAALDDLDDIQAVGLRKIIVALVVRRDRHDRACAVAHHDIVGDEDRDLFFRDRVGRGDALDPDARLVLDKLCALEFRLLRAFQTVCFHRVEVRDPVFILIQHRMLRGHDHEGDAVERIAPGRVDLHHVFGTGDREIHECAFGAADPGHFLLLDAVREIEPVEAVKKLVRVFGDPQIPDVLRQLDDVAVADIAFAALGVFVGKDDLAVRAVVDERFRTEYEAVLEQFQEDPLGPLVVIRTRGREFPAPVEGEADAFQLICEVLDILLRNDVRVGVRLDRVVFRRQAEGVIAEREQDVIALHAALSGEHFDARIGLDMADVHAGARRIRELDEAVPLRLFREVDRLEGFRLLPSFLPLLFDRCKIVFHVFPLSHPAKSEYILKKE